MQRRDPSPDGDPTGPCPACGAVVPADAAACPACGEPVAATGDDAPLPPLPDGGLAALMPTWLRDAPASAANEAGGSALSDRLPAGAAQGFAPSAPSRDDAAPPEMGESRRPATEPGAAAVFAIGAFAGGATQTGAPPGKAAAFDPASVISADDLPAWLRAIGGVSAGSFGPPAESPDETLPEAAPLPDAEAPAAPLYLPRAEARPVASAADVGTSTGSTAEPAALIAATGTGRPAAPERAIGADLAPDLPVAEPSVVASLTPGDDGTLPSVAAERGEPSAAASIPTVDTDAAVAAAEPAPEPGPAGHAAMAPDPSHHDGSRGPLPEGIAAGIATIAIMIVVAAILFLVWRALAAQ